MPRFEAQTEPGAPKSIAGKRHNDVESLKIGGVPINLDNLILLSEINDALRGQYYEWIYGLANITKEVLAPLCARVEIVGSIRRGKPHPGDIDILAIPKPNVTAADILRILKSKLADSNVVMAIKGSLRFRFQGIKCDIILTDSEKWGMGMLQFTGPREFNLLWDKFARQNGYTVKNGTLGTLTGDRYNWVFVPAMNNLSESEILDHIGLLMFEDPRLRNIDELLPPETIKQIRHGIIWNFFRAIWKLITRH